MSFRGANLLVLLALSAVVWPGRGGADGLSELQARFDHETNSVHKAKLLEKLGDAQFEVTRQASQANDFKTIGLVMEKYRDNVRAALTALKHDHPDAERHTGGYKQLQMHVNKAIREVDQTLVVAPAEFRPPLELVRTDLATMDDELLELLFPRRSDDKKPAEHKKTPPVPPPATLEKSP
jgi:hypothetical protein